MNPLRRCFRPLHAALAFSLFGISGCAMPREQIPVVEARPEIPAIAMLTTSEIQPVPVLPIGPATVEHEPAPQAMRHLRTGQERFNEGLWADATSALEKALQVDPDLIEARILLARAAMQHGNLPLATSHLEEAARLAPRNPAVHQLQGELALSHRKRKQAIASFRLALLASEDTPRRPERVLAHLSLALALKEEGYLAAAAEQLEAYLSAVREPTSEMESYRELREMRILYRGRAPALLGEILLELRQPERSVEAYRIAVEQSPEDAALAAQYVSALAKAGRHDEAIDRAARNLTEADDFTENNLALLETVCRQAGRPQLYDEQLVRIAEQSDRPGVRIRISEILLDRGKRQPAAQVLTGVCEADPQNTDALQLLARLRLELGEATDAAVMLHRLLSASPEAYDVVERLIGNSASTGVIGALTEVVRARQARDWNNATGCLLLALCELAAGRSQEAAVQCREALRLDPEYTTATVLLARIALQQHDYAAALASADAAIKDGAELPELHMICALACDALGEDTRAEAAFLDAFRLDRSRPEPLLRLAESIERRGDLVRSEQLYRRILDDVDPRCIPARERLVRLLLNTQKTDRAKEYFADFERLGQSGGAVERCRALLKLATSRAVRGQERLDEYRSDLRRILEKHPGEAATHMALAMSHEAVGEYKDALREVDAALAIDAADVDALKRRAEYLSRLLDFRLAVETTRRLLEIRPNDLDARHRLVRFSLALGDLDTAAAELRNLLDREADSEFVPLYRNQLAAVLGYAKRHEERIELARHWLDEQPDDQILRELYLSALRDAGRMDEAVSAARRWLDEEPTDTAWRQRYIGQLVAAKRFAEAQQRVLEWLEEDADDYELTALLVGVFWEARDAESAVETVQTGMEDPRFRREYERMLATSYRLLQRWDDAVEVYRRIGGRLRSEGTDQQLFNTLIEAQRFDEVEKEVNGLLSQKTSAQDGAERFDYATLVALRRQMARIFQLTDRNMQAIQQLEEVFELTKGLSEANPHSGALKQELVGIHNDLGYTLADEGIRLDEAERMIRHALSEEPLNSAYLDSLGWVYYKQGRFEAAIELLERAILLTARDDAVMYDHLADALYRAGRVDEARKNWEEALRLSDRDRYPPPILEDLRLHEAVRAKLAQLDRGETVETAPLAQTEQPERDGSAARQASTKPPGGDAP